MTESPPIPFSQNLRRSTLEIHDRAQYSTFMAALFDGRLGLEDYATLVSQYWFVYGALEEGADRLADDPVVGGFAVDALRRRPALAEDLAFLRDQGWTGELTPLPATARYAARVREMVSEWPPGWVAHHYTRYLGDIAGGQAVGKLLHRFYGVAGPGARFYDFTALGPVPTFRTSYRAMLDGAPWDEAERARLIDEAHHAFELNIAMFEDLAATVDPARLTRPA